eukprot:TRINITY_DN8289_c0_g1_i1.p1 TRINITY_DN8289_c0_g1~~TRINITY_DN8289_c0_g1_i1.p1  ORF type:complete len:309 (-),score=51.31 TRINITY_DN8289_c0_g1_i1:138-980(-)
MNLVQKKLDSQTTSTLKLHGLPPLPLHSVRNWSITDLKPLPNEKLSPWFIFIGASHSGAESLVHALKWEHPGVCFAGPLHSNWLHSNSTDYRLADVYRHCNWTRYFGEFSANYLEGEPRTFPKLVKRHFPHTKIIAVLRNPIDRLFSEWKSDECLGRHPPDFFEIYAEENKLKKRNGKYAELLQPWFEEFPRDQILLLLSQDYIEKPTLVLKTVQRFLELPPVEFGDEIDRPPSPQGLLCRQHVPNPKKMHPIYRENLQRFYASDISALEKILKKNLTWT